MNVDEFRSRLRAWLDNSELSPTTDDSLDGQVAQLTRVRRALYDAGWMRHGWPTEVGGLGGPAVCRAILGEEVMTRELADPNGYSMVEVLAPTMISFAQPALAAQAVPLLLSGREHWCQGFSEPGSGSDLASLTTRAQPRGDDWVVTGQKVWTSFAQYSARCVLLTRTGPGHGGITAFFVDMDTPGITVRPLRTMHGVDEFTEVYFDDVVVPADRMLGGPGDGWRVAMDLLPYERSSCFWHRIAYLYTRLDRLLTQTTAPDDADDYELGAAYLALHTVRCRSYATQQRLTAGGQLGPETSIDKVLLATAEQRLFDTVRDLLPGELELTESHWRPQYLFSRAATIYGGTAEIQRNIIARRLLELGAE
jgi:alkylation response protein AidB-like acyl-CoA dehydrogenase